MKRFAFIATGGTIASVVGKDGMHPGISSTDLLAHITTEGQQAEFIPLLSFALDSSNLSPSHWIKLADTIAQHRQEFDGFLITHGTDTMAYTAAALSIMLENIDVPVVLTGSQLSIGEAGSDAEWNLLSAVAVLQSGHSGVYLAFGGKIIDGSRAKKIRTENFDGFDSINAPLCGEYRGWRLHWFVPEKEITGAFCLHDQLERQVAVVKLVPGFSPQILFLLFDVGYRAIIIEGFGAGGVPTDKAEYSLLPALDEAKRRGIRIIGTTQCLYNGANLNRYENGVLALRRGIISGGDYTTEYLLAKTMVELGEGA